MSADLARSVKICLPGLGPAVTVLAPLVGPPDRNDLERPETSTVEVFEALTQVLGGADHQLVPLRRLVQPGPYGFTKHRGVEMLDATTLEDVAAALGQSESPLVHAIGWEAGVVAAALGSSDGDRTTVVLEPLGVPDSYEWTLADHAAALVVPSDAVCRDALRHGVLRAALSVIPLATPPCPVPVDQAVGTADRPGALLAVVGDSVDYALLAGVEAILRADDGAHVVFAGAANRLVRGRKPATIVRGWPAAVACRVHGASRVTWQLLDRVDAVLDAGGRSAAPRAALATLAAGKALVAVAHRPAADLVDPGRSGLVLARMDPIQLAGRVGELLSARHDLRLLGAAGRQRWGREHSPQVRAARLAELYDRVRR